MSAVLDRIAFYWFGRGDSTFLTPRSMFEKEDVPLIDAGVFHPSGQELNEIPCPFGCSEREPIHLIEGKNGEIEHFVFCSQGEGEKILTPHEYELLAFDSRAYAAYMGRYGNTPIPPKQKRRHTHPQSTDWIATERAAVIEFADNPNLNKAKKLPHELCQHVWNLNREEFEEAALLPADKRGYKNAAALRAYFYRLRH